MCGSMVADPGLVLRECSFCGEHQAEGWALVPGFTGMVYDIPAHPLSALEGPTFRAVAHMIPCGAVGSPGPAEQGESR